MMTVKDFLDVFKNPNVTVEVRDSVGDLLAKEYAIGKDTLNTAISSRVVNEIKTESVNLITITVEDQP